MGETWAVVTHNVTSMRAEPDRRAEMVSQALLGEMVRYGEEKDGFAEIVTPDGYPGWASVRHLTILEPGTRYPEPVRAAMVADLFLPVFRQPSGQSERISLLTLGTAVELAEGDADAVYYPVRLPDGAHGFVEGGALIVPHYPPLEALGPNLAIVARGLIGVPYLWGGRTPFGIDCSGFTQRVYALCGWRIPRDAYQQAASDLFEPVERGDVRAGDLVFFAGDEDPRGRGVTHVGLAQADGRFIHASGQDGVAITPLNAAPYDRQFWGARRLPADA